MSQGAYVTLVGYVAQEPSIRTTKTGKTVTDLRVGITPRYRDQATGEWRDAESSYFTVSCWDRLAQHVRASMHKGEPVLVRGKFKTDTYEDKDGRPKTDTRDHRGHRWARPEQGHRQLHQAPVQAASRGRRPGGRPAGDWATEQVPGNIELAGGPDEMIDEDAIERFGRDLDDADFAARTLTEDRDAQDEGEDDEEDDDAAETAASAVPRRPTNGSAPVCQVPHGTDAFEVIA